MPNWSDDEGRCHFNVDGVPCHQSGTGCPTHRVKPTKKTSKQVAIDAAFKRGVEAMRKAAMGACWHSAAMALYRRIEIMPDPEDKP